MSRPFLSVIIPTYNRPQHLAPLLDSIVAQDFADWEVVVGEDHSPSRDAVRAIVDDYAQRTGGRVRGEYHDTTFGYDRNLRTLVRLARGRFVFIMGDDDFVLPGAFATVASALARHPEAGVILRAFSWFVGDPSNVVQVTRYYPGECVFPAGQKAILACYRRLVCMSGLVVDRDLAVACDTERWDGSLFYQHWMIGSVLAKRDAVYLPELLVNFRRGSPRSFGTAAAERDLYTPGQEPPDTTWKGLYFQFEIAKALEEAYGIPLVPDVIRDYANYSFPQFAAHRGRRFGEYYGLYRRLGALGMSRHLSFHAWFWGIALLGAGNAQRLVSLVRERVGHTPNLTRMLRAEILTNGADSRSSLPARRSGGTPLVSPD